MGKNSDTCTQVMTYHRSVAHIVEGLAQIFFSLFTMIVLQLQVQEPLLVILIINGLIDCAKGIILLPAIFKENRRLFLIYLVINIFTLLIKHGFLIFVTVVTLPFLSHMFFSLLWLCLLTLYLIYEWFMVHSVIKSRKNLQSSSHKGDGNVEFYYGQHKDEPADNMTV